MKKVFALISPLVVLLLLALLAMPAFAGSVSFSGSLQNPDPTWDRVDVGCGGSTGIIEWYDVQQFYVSQNGTYTIEMTGLYGRLTRDGFFALYQNSFNLLPKPRTA
jgi:hypothetical protein